MEELSNFASLGLRPDLVEHLLTLNFVEPTEIQRLTIPELLTGQRDILGVAKTGTGKTASFALPIIEHLQAGPGPVEALIMAPTRELARQITADFTKLKGARNLTAVAIYGGQSYDTQIRGLKDGARIVVGTPGRLIDLLDRHVLKLDQVRYVVLDEADEMLNMGFIEDIQKILEFIPQQRRMMLFSATIPPKIKHIVSRFMQNKLEINLHGDRELTTSLTRQIYYELFARDKFEALRRIIDANPDFYGIVFCRTRIETDEVNQWLMQMGYASEALHGEITQAQREKIVHKFRSLRLKVLVATDVASRGVDIEGLTHVINFSMPSHPELYVHRIGRTGRAGKSGTAISLVTPTDRYALEMIKRFSKSDITKEAPPSVKNIMKAQKARILSHVNDVLAKYMENPEEPKLDDDRFLQMSEKILSHSSPNLVVAALLRLNYAGKLEPGVYRDITLPPVRSPEAFRGGTEAFARRTGFSHRKRQDEKSHRRTKAVVTR